MFTLTCTLKFKDGKTAGATVSAHTPYDEVPIVYFGSNRPARSYGTATPSLLKTIFKNLAKETGATLDIKTEGEYDVDE